MNWLSGLFTTSRTADKTVDLVGDTVRGVGTWVDELNFTEEEKIKSNIKLLDFRLKALSQTQDESSIRSISRRFLAWSVTFTFLLLLLLSTVGEILGMVWAENVLNISKLLVNPFWTIIAFYFVGHIGNSWIEKNNKT